MTRKVVRKKVMLYLKLYNSCHQQFARISISFQDILFSEYISPHHLYNFICISVGFCRIQSIFLIYYLVINDCPQGSSGLNRSRLRRQLAMINYSRPVTDNTPHSRNVSSATSLITACQRHAQIFEPYGRATKEPIPRNYHWI